MINKKILGLIGLAARSRSVAFGADSVELRNKKEKGFFDYCSTEMHQTEQKINLKS